MIRKQPWFDRQFPTGLPADLFPVVVERLRGMPARLEDRLSSLPASILTRRSGSTWSPQENAGHLLDLEPLWLARVEDLLARRPEMTPADLTNRRTHEANHNAAPLGTILSGFRQARSVLVRRLEAVEDTALTYTAPHPRLRALMSVVDHVFFVAEHDDYHLARTTELLSEFGMV
ncbi:MAG: DinB family protein [Armatimonadota bacterium]